MQVCISFQTNNHASTSLLKFFTGRMPFLPPNQQRQSTEGNNSTDLWQILESVLILPTCGNLELLFLPLRWRYFLITIPSCIYGYVHQRAQSWPVGPLGFKNSCMLILIFSHVCSLYSPKQIMVANDNNHNTTNNHHPCWRQQTHSD